jgi:hypothetical protein
VPWAHAEDKSSEGAAFASVHKCAIVEGNVKKALLALLAAAGMLWLIASVNVTSLMLALATRLRRDIAVRAAVKFIDFQGLGFNPLQVRDRESRMAYLDVAGTLRDIFATIFPEIGDIQAERIRKAIKDSFVETRH